MATATAAGEQRACAEACDPVFLEWCRAKGVQVNSVAPAFFADSWRGVVATRAIGPGDVLVAVPEALLMTGCSARRDPVLGPLLQKPEYARLSDHQVGAWCSHGCGVLPPSGLEGVHTVMTRPPR